MPQSPARRSAAGSRPAPSFRRSGPAARGKVAANSDRTPGVPRPGGRTPTRGNPGPSGPDKPEHEILFQQYFKSVGPRTYAAQVKRASNGNHYLVLTEGKRDESTGEVRKTRLFVYSEDFVEFFKLLQSTAQFIRANPVPDEVKKKRDRYWAKQAEAPKPAGAAVPQPPGAAAG